MNQLPTPDDLIPLLRYAGAAVGVLLLLGLALRERRAGQALAGAIVAAALAWLWLDRNDGGLPPIPLIENADRVLQSTERVLISVFAAGLAGVLVAFLPRTLRWAPRLATAALLCGWVLETPAGRWEGTEAALWLFGLAGALVLWQDILDRAAHARPGPDVLLLISLAAGVLGQACVAYGSAKLAEMSGVIAMIAGGACVLAPWFGKIVNSPAVIGVLTTALFGIGLDAAFFGSDPVIPWQAMAMFAAAPVVVLLGRLPPIAAARPRLTRAAALVLALAVLAFGFWTASSETPEPVEDDPYLDMYKPR